MALSEPAKHVRFHPRRAIADVKFHLSPWDTETVGAAPDPEPFVVIDSMDSNIILSLADNLREVDIHW